MVIYSAKMVTLGAIKFILLPRTEPKRHTNMRGFSNVEIICQWFGKFMIGLVIREVFGYLDFRGILMYELAVFGE